MKSLNAFLQVLNSAEQNIKHMASDAKIVRQLTAWFQQGVTGIFSFCDVEAWSSMTLLEKNGCEIPENLTFVGFDNILGYIHFPRPITSVSGDLREEARAAIKLLRNRIHEPDLPPQHIVIPVELVRRDA